MPSDLTKKAVDMLLKGATLLSEPCPYCKGVRVMKEGTALCVNCGRTPDEKKSGKKPVKKEKKKKPTPALEILEKKLQELSNELEKETNYKKQQQILKIINSLAESISKLKHQK